MATAVLNGLTSSETSSVQNPSNRRYSRRLRQQDTEYSLVENPDNANNVILTELQPVTTSPPNHEMLTRPLIESSTENLVDQDTQSDVLSVEVIQDSHFFFKRGIRKHFE